MQSVLNLTAESDSGDQRDQIIEETCSARAVDSSTAPAEGREGQGGAEVHRPDSYVIIHNVAKKHNIGTLLRSCTAFGVKQIVLVGKKEFNAFGSHGTVDFVNLKHCYSLTEAKEYLEGEGCRVCGVEITEGAQAVNTHPFTGNTAFLLGNEGSGLSDKEMAICDSFLYIPQYGPGTASLNVTVAASIVLHNFAVWAQYVERGRKGQKFVVGDRPMRRASRNVVSDNPSEVAARRKSRTDVDWLDESESKVFARTFDLQVDE